MPKTDYNNTVIYKIQHKELDDLLYIGHTTNFAKRKVRHKSNCYKVDGSHYNLKLYSTIRDNDGWDAFSMVVIKEFPCENKRQAEAEEDKVIRETLSTLNMKRAYETPEERDERRLKSAIKWREDNHEYIKEKKRQYYQENKEYLKDYQKKHYIEKNDEITIYNKEYRQKNIVKLKEYIQNYQQENTEHIKEYKKEYYIKNRDKLNEKIDCPCGGRYIYQSKNRHFKTKKHQDFLKNNS